MANDVNDLTIQDGQQSKGAGDINLGAYYHSDDLWISAGWTHQLPNQ